MRCITLLGTQKYCTWFVCVFSFIFHSFPRLKQNGLASGAETHGPAAARQGAPREEEPRSARNGAAMDRKENDAASAAPELPDTPTP